MERRGERVWKHNNQQFSSGVQLSPWLLGYNNVVSHSIWGHSLGCYDIRQGFIFHGGEGGGTRPNLMMLSLGGMPPEFFLI